MGNRNTLIGWSDDQWNTVRQAVSEEAHKARVAASFLPPYGPLPPSTQVVPSERFDPATGRVDDVSTAPMVELYVEVVLSQQQVKEEELSSALLAFRQAASAVATVEDQIIFNGQYDYSIQNGTPTRTLQEILNRPHEYHRVEAASGARAAKAAALQAAATVGTAVRNEATADAAAAGAEAAVAAAEATVVAARDAATARDGRAAAVRRQNAAEAAARVAARERDERAAEARTAETTTRDARTAEDNAALRANAAATEAAAAALNVYGRVKVKDGEQDYKFHSGFFGTYLLSKATLTGGATTWEILDNFHYERLKATNPGSLGLLASTENVQQVRRTALDLVPDLIDAITQLEKRRHLAPLFCVLGTTAFVATQTPIRNTGVLPSDRVEPVLGSQIRRSSAIDPNQGVILSLAGDPIDLAVAVDASPEFLNINDEGKYRFRVVERFALRIKDPEAIVRLEFVP